MANPGLTPAPRPPLIGPGRRATRDLCVNLSRLLRAGIGITEALETLAQGASPGDYVGAALLDIRRELDRGDGLSVALGRHPRLFRRAEIQAVRAAERIGELSPAFDAIAEAIDGWLHARGALARRATYPMMVLLVGVVVGPLPKVVTSGAGAYGRLVGTNLALIAALVLGCVFGLPWLMRNTRLGEEVRRLAWRLPWPARIYRDHVRATFYAVLARNLGAGLPVFEALGSAGAVTADARTEAAATSAGRAVGEGSELAPALVDAGLVPSSERMMVVAGERAGTLDESLRVMATLYRERAAAGLGRLMSVLGGALTVLVFIFIALSILGTFQDVQKSTTDVMDMIEQESPIRRGR